MKDEAMNGTQLEAKFTTIGELMAHEAIERRTKIQLLVPKARKKSEDEQLRDFYCQLETMFDDRRHP